jgi:hypothetical protein
VREFSVLRPAKVKEETKEGRRPPLTWAQVGVLMAVVIVLVVIVDFSQRLATSQRLVDSANKAGTEVAQLETEQAVLKTQVAYATMDVAVIEWAHESGRLVRPGEVLVVPIIPTVVATPVQVSIALPAPSPNYVLWWEMFFEPSAVFP